MKPLEGRAYESLREFIHEQEAEALADMVKAVGNTRRSGGDPPHTSRFVFFTNVMEKVKDDMGSEEVKWVFSDIMAAEMEEKLIKVG